jgi:tRNA G37 N-methylase Trm5
VRSSIAAARATRRKLRVYAVEKNPAAIVHIQRMVRCEGWQEIVTIVHQDMRDWTPPELVRHEALYTPILRFWYLNNVSVCTYTLLALAAA